MPSSRAASNQAAIKQRVKWSVRPSGFSNATNGNGMRPWRQLKAQLERGAAEAERGDLLYGDEAFHELLEMIEERWRSQAANR